MKKKMLGLALLVSASMLAGSTAYAADKTTKYRVYQNDQLLMEFSDYAKAQQYASGFAHSHVEEIGSRSWLWNNFARYRVYQYDVTLPGWEFSNLDDAVREARRWSHASVRDLQTAGWVWNNYPKYRLYQGEITLDSWEFATLADAVTEAKKWGNSHIIDLGTNSWVWDNISDATRQQYREGKPVYRVYQGSYSNDAWAFPSLEDAAREALKWANSTVVNTDRGNAVVFSNLKTYQVYQNDNLLDSYVGLDDAISYAKRWAHATVQVNNRVIWTNTPTYAVYQNDNRIGEFSTIPGALSYALQYANSSIRDENGQSIWDNSRKLMYWGWNGVSSLSTIKGQLGQTQGLDVDSPTFFELADAAGNLKDTSAKETVDELKKLGYSVQPLVSNQFDASLTSQFFSSSAAEDKFISSLVNRAAALGLDGLNIDFESMAGKDRAAFTAFMRKLTDAAHSKGITVSVDIPRGDVKWNQLTAIDHEALAGIADYIMVMTYDQYYSGSSSPGSVAGLQWVEKGIQDLLSYGIPRDKLLLGIPFYVRDWALGAGGNVVSSKALYTRDLSALLAGKNAVTTWDDSFQQYKVEYQDNGVKHVLWLENDATVKARLDLAKKYDLAGIAMWRLGQEPSSFWNTMIQNK